MVTKEVLISTDDGLELQFDVEILIFVELESYWIVAFGHIDLLIDFFSLLEDVLFLKVEARLQRLEHLDHELLVDVIFPVVD